MKTSVWGPSAWRFLHAVTFAYPDTPTQAHKDAARNLFKSLKLMLPCGDCCTHYCSGFDTDPVDLHLDSRDSLSRWLVKFHNSVNARLGKPQYSFEKAKSEFDAENETCSAQSSCADNPTSASRNDFGLKVVTGLLALVLVALVVRRLV